MVRFRLSTSFVLALGFLLSFGCARAGEQCPPISKSASISVRATVISPLGVTADDDGSHLAVWGSLGSEPQIQQTVSRPRSKTEWRLADTRDSDSPHIRARAELRDIPYLRAAPDSVVVSVIYLDQ